MLHRAFSEPAPALAGLLGAALLAGFWAACLLGPAALAAAAAGASGARSDAMAAVVALGLAGTVVALGRALRRSDVWRGM